MTSTPAPKFLICPRCNRPAGEKHADITYHIEFLCPNR